MSPPLHPLLLRQLRRLGLSEDAASVDARAWASLLERISGSFADADRERYLMERSQSIASREMEDLNQALQVSQQRLTSLLSLSSDWIWEQDANGRFRYFSQPPAASAGIDLDALLGRSLADDPVLNVLPDYQGLLALALHERKPFRDVVFGGQSRSGQPYFLRISGEPVWGPSGEFTGYRGVGCDVTVNRLAELQIEQLAHYDALTGLPNRATLMDELPRALARAQRQGTQLAVLFIDLDRFKHVNDTLGHAAGDDLLRTIATRLKSLLRESDLLARIGGDEFVALLEGVTDQAMLGRAAARMLSAMAQPIMLGPNQAQVSGSVGISLFPTDGTSAATLLKNADAAMYLAKQQGKNNFQYYTEHLAELSARTFALESELRHATDGSQLLLHYQPKFKAIGGDACGLEALLRWQHPTRGLLHPADFIDVAEESGLIVPIGQWVLESTCRQLRHWLDTGLQPLPCAVNVSARQFAAEDFVDGVIAVLRSHGIPPALLDIEITESMLMEAPDKAVARLEGLREAGVSVSIDDFGTGYSSLHYLKRFPAQTLKLDRTFVSGLPNDRGDAAIVRSVLALAHSLGIRVVAEGVETFEQLAFLQEQRCDEVQGYLLGRPGEAEQMTLLLSARR